MSRTSITLGLALVGALLAGCSSTDAPAEKPAAAATESLPAAAPSEDGRCSSGPVRSLIGKAATPNWWSRPRTPPVPATCAYSSRAA